MTAQIAAASVVDAAAARRGLHLCLVDQQGVVHPVPGALPARVRGKQSVEDQQRVHQPVSSGSRDSFLEAGSCSIIGKR